VAAEEEAETPLMAIKMAMVAGPVVVEPAALLRAVVALRFLVKEITAVAV